MNSAQVSISGCSTPLQALRSPFRKCHLTLVPRSRPTSCRTTAISVGMWIMNSSPSVTPRNSVLPTTSIWENLTSSTASDMLSVTAFRTASSVPRRRRHTSAKALSSPRSTSPVRRIVLSVSSATTVSTIIVLITSNTLPTPPTPPTRCVWSWCPTSPCPKRRIGSTTLDVSVPISCKVAPASTPVRDVEREGGKDEPSSLMIHSTVATTSRLCGRATAFPSHHV